MTNVASREGAEPAVGGDAPPRRVSQLLSPNSWNLFRRDAAPARPRGWPRRIPAEVEVARILGELGEGWTILRASDGLADFGADFLVVGQSGIFTISAARPAGGNIWVDENVLWQNGRPTDHVRTARRHAERAASVLAGFSGIPVNVAPVIVLLDPDDISFGGDPARRVRVLPSDLLVRSLAESRPVHSPEATAYFAMIAEECSTWSALR